MCALARNDSKSASKAVTGRPALPYCDFQEMCSGATIRFYPYALTPSGHSLKGIGRGTSPSMHLCQKDSTVFVECQPKSGNIPRKNYFIGQCLTKHGNFIIITELNGVWRSLVSRLVRVQEASGSNPDTPTMENTVVSRELPCFSYFSEQFASPCVRLSTIYLPLSVENLLSKDSAMFVFRAISK